MFGGCCGTTPEYIALLRRELEGRTVRRVTRTVPAAVCSGTQAVPIDRVRVIGERINPTGKKLMKEALRRGDVDYMLNQALAQTEAGADTPSLCWGSILRSSPLCSCPSSGSTAA